MVCIARNRQAHIIPFLLHVASRVLMSTKHFTWRIYWPLPLAFTSGHISHFKIFSLIMYQLYLHYVVHSWLVVKHGGSSVIYQVWEQQWNILGHSHRMMNDIQNRLLRLNLVSVAFILLENYQTSPWVDPPGTWIEAIDPFLMLRH